MVVPFAAGSGSDVLARLLGPRLSEILGQQVIIENVGGAGGMTGTAKVAKAPPDGYQFESETPEHMLTIKLYIKSRCTTQQPISHQWV